MSSALRFTYILFGIALALLLSVCASESESDTSHLDALVLCGCAPSAVSPDRRRRLCCHPHVPRQAAPGKARGIWACVPAESVQQGRGSLAPASTGPGMAFLWKDTPKGGPGKREWPEHFPLVFGHRRRQASLPEALGFWPPPFFWCGCQACRGQRHLHPDPLVLWRASGTGSNVCKVVIRGWDLPPANILLGDRILFIFAK